MRFLKNIHEFTSLLLLLLFLIGTLLSATILVFNLYYESTYLVWLTWSLLCYWRVCCLLFCRSALWSLRKAAGLTTLYVVALCRFLFIFECVVSRMCCQYRSLVWLAMQRSKQRNGHREHTPTKHTSLLTFIKRILLLLPTAQKVSRWFVSVPFCAVFECMCCLGPCVWCFVRTLGTSAAQHHGKIKQPQPIRPV